MWIWLWIGIGYLLFQASLLLLFLFVTRRVDRRYKAQLTVAPEGYEPTKEIHIDPIRKKRMRVYYNSNTGERAYVEE